MVRFYTERVATFIESGKFAGEVDPAVDTAAAGTLFVCTIQRLVMQSLLIGITTIKGARAADIFAICRRGVENRL